MGIMEPRIVSYQTTKIVLKYVALSMQLAKTLWCAIFCYYKMKFTLQFTPSVQNKTQQIPHPIYYKNYFMKNQSLVKPKSFLCIMLVKQNTDFFSREKQRIGIFYNCNQKAAQIIKHNYFFRDDHFLILPNQRSCVT